MRVEIVIPVLNEEKTLERQIQHLVDFLQDVSGYGHDVSITIADNGSTDLTEIIGLQLDARYKSVKYRRIDRRGVGLALKTTWTESNADIVGLMDLDFATNLEHLKEAWDLLDTDDYDVVSGNRNSKFSVVQNRKAVRKWTSRSLNFLVKKVFSTNFSDGMCGFKFLRSKNVPLILENSIGFEGWFFSTELLIVSEYLNLRVAEIPIRWVDDRDSKVKIVGLTIEYLRNILVLRRHIYTNFSNR